MEGRGLRTILLAAVVTLSPMMPAGAKLRQWMVQAYSQQELEWFDQQTIPGKTERCCSMSDGTNAVERYDASGALQTRFHVREWNDDERYRAEYDVDWMNVPPESIIDGQHSPSGVAVVWWGKDEFGNIIIRCFVRGARF